MYVQTQGSIYCLLCLSVWIGLWPHLPHIPSEKGATLNYAHTHNQKHIIIRVKKKRKKNKYTTAVEKRNRKQNAFFLFSRWMFSVLFSLEELLEIIYFPLLFLFSPVMILSLWGFFFFFEFRLNTQTLCVHSTHTHDDDSFSISSLIIIVASHIYLSYQQCSESFFFSFLVRQDRMLHCHYSQKGKYNNQQMSFEELLFANNWIYISQGLTQHSLNNIQ